MEWITLLKQINPNVLGILTTGLLGFIAWIVKGLVEIPLVSSKEIFYKFLERRIEFLSEIKVRLSFIAYFPSKDGNEFKEQLQQILLRDGKSAYLDRILYDTILKIAITEETNENLIIKTIEEINNDLAQQINKIQQSNRFFYKYHNTEPSKRIFGFFLLALFYTLLISLLLCTIILFLHFVVFGSWVERASTLIIGVLLIYLVNKWINK